MQLWREKPPLPNKAAHKASKVARAIANLEGHDPDGVFLFLIERFYNMKMSDKDRIALGLSLMPYTKRRLAPIPAETVQKALEENRLVIIAGD